MKGLPVRQMPGISALVRRVARVAVAMAFVATLVPTASANGLRMPSQVGIGGMVVVTPTYEGSNRYEAVGVPLIDLDPDSKAAGLIDVEGVDDIRLRLFRAGGFEAGPLFGYRFGREESDGPRLLGMGEIDGGVVVGGYAGYRFGSLFPFVSYHHQVSGDDTGGVARFGLELKHNLSSRIALTTVAGASWANDDYMQSYFGVSAAQAITSAHAQFQADAGLKDAFLGMTADVRLTDLWSLKLTGRYAHLLGDAADSPITASEHQLFGGVGLTYKFSLR
ncbi:MAG: MipA/OmpV family protein [Hyphomicrobiaceae bacterium]